MSDSECEARDLDRTLRRRYDVVQDDELVGNPTLAQALASVLFQKKTMMVNGYKLQYVASKRESVKTLRALLSIRNVFLADQLIPRHDCAGNRTVFTKQMRDRLLDSWKASFHSDPEQQLMQIRDSWKEDRRRSRGGAAQPTAGKGMQKGKAGPVQPTAGKGMQKGKLGRNSAAVISGKHSRWSRYMQREFGSMNLALAIIFTGDVSLEKLRTAQASQPGASQPGDWAKNLEHESPR